MTSLRLRIAALVIASAALVGLPAGVAHAQTTEVCPTGETIAGIDVSKWQDAVDWDAVAASGIDFAFIRVSDSLDSEDQLFERNWDEARRVGIRRGAYQFFRGDQDPVAQADLVIEKMGPLEPGDLPPVIDVESDEVTGEVLAAAVQAWIDRIEEVYGVTPIVYTGGYFWPDAVGDDPSFAQYPLWIANWGVDCPGVPAPWTGWTFWQTSATGDVPGVDGDVDTNLFDGTLADLDAFAGVTETMCGDGVCHPAERRDRSCVEDCPVCDDVLAGLEATLDETSSCFVLTGDEAAVTIDDSGAGGGALVVDGVAGDPTHTGRWNLRFDVSGEYLIEARVLGGGPVAHPYDVYGNAALETFEVDTSTAGWAEVGRVGFQLGGSQWVEVGNATGDPAQSMAFDALRFTRVADEIDDDRVVIDLTPERDPEDAGSDVESDMESDVATSGPPLPTGGDGDDGCGCRVRNGGERDTNGGWPAVALGVAFLALLHRRRQ